MECLGPQCAAMLLDWLQARALADGSRPGGAPAGSRPLFVAVPYQDEAPAIRTPAELAGAVEHLEYAVFRRFHNQLTRAERSRLENTIENALFKVDRYLDRLDPAERERVEGPCRALREAVVHGREQAERMRSQARRADLKIAQLGALTPEGFEEFVAEVFEALGYAVERVGGSGDEGADLRVARDGLRGVVQCKYQGKAVVGSPLLQKFLGTVHHTRSHKGFFVTTSTFSLAAEKFIAEHPIELIDGPRLVELVREALGPGARRGGDAEADPTLF